MIDGFRGILFDRDGVLNKLVPGSEGLRAPWSLAELELFDEAQGLMQLLKLQGRKVGIITNQPDAARGKCSYSSLIRVHHEVCSLLDVQWSHLCLHSDGECLCRKPAPGGVKMVLEKMKERPASCVIVGDRWTDILAGQRAGLATILVSQDLEESFSPTSGGQFPNEELRPDHIVTGLAGLMQLLLQL